MAVLFRIDATPGPSTFGAQGDFYFDKGAGDSDALYPAIYVADALDVVGGKFDLDTASPSDYQTCGMWLNPLGSESAGGPGSYANSTHLNLGGPDQQGPFYMEALFHPSVTSIADVFYAPLIYLTKPNSDELFGAFVYGDDSSNGGVLEVFRNLDGAGSGYWSELNPDFTAPSGTRYVAGDPYKVRLEWLTGTVDGSFNVASDGWWRLIINDIEATGQTNVPLYLDLTPTLVADVNKVAWAAIGFDGTIGPWDYFEIGTIEEEPEAIQAYIFGRGAAADDKATVVSDLTVLMNLDGQGRTVNEPNTLYVAGDLIVTGTTTFTGDVVTTEPATLFSQLLFDEAGEMVADEDGDPLYSEG